MISTHRALYCALALPLFIGCGPDAVVDAPSADDLFQPGSDGESPGITLNRPPVARAGDDIEVNSGDDVFLSAAESMDPDGDELNFTWRQVAGPSITLQESGTVITGFIAPTVSEAMRLTFRLNVSDGSMSDADDAVVTVTPEALPVPPVANAGPDQRAALGSVVQLDGSASSGGGLTFEWMQIDGPKTDLRRASSPRPTFQAPDVESHFEFELIVTEQGGLLDRDRVRITVAPQPVNAPPAPVADAGPDQEVEEGAEVVLDGSGSYAADTLTFAWAQVAGPSVEIREPDAQKTGFIAPAVDEEPVHLTFELTVSSAHASDIDTVSFLVLPSDDVLPPAGGGGGGGGGGGTPPLEPCELDSDEDGLGDCTDGCPQDPAKAEPGNCGCGVSDVDSDGDSIPDCNDHCPGETDADSDGDGSYNCDDGCPTDPSKTLPGACGCGVSDADTDSNGTPDCLEGCPDESDSDADGTLDCFDQCASDPQKVVPGVCGCSVSEQDGDGDSVPDCIDQCPGTLDVDSDSDGAYNCVDGCPFTPGQIHPGPCGCGILPIDGDGDGTANCIDGCPGNPNKTAPGVCGCSAADTDSDGDGTPNCNDGCPNNPAKIAPGVCGCSTADTDSDGDGTPNCSDGCASDPNKISPGVCGCGTSDADSDGDGVPNCIDNCSGQADIDSDGDGTLNCQDGCPNDPSKIAPGTCGCGVAETDGDSDGTPNCTDACPGDSNKVLPGVCGCGVTDADSDSDGIPNCHDGCPSDPHKTAPGECGCGVAETDSDNDGTPNCDDGCPSDPNKTSPGACGCGTSDLDSDADGTPNCQDGCPADPNKTWAGACGCGVPEGDSDSDGVPNCHDGCPADPNKAAPGICGCGQSDADSDSDGTANCADLCPGHDDDADSDGDGIPNGCDAGGQPGSYSQDFEGYNAGQDPAGWVDTGANNGLAPTDLFEVMTVGNQRAFGTTSIATNIHSHYVGAGSADWSHYQYSGRMMITDANGGIGVTFFSDYNHSDSYYRIRRNSTEPTFVIDPHPDNVVAMSGGSTDTGVVPAANVWYRFKIEVEDHPAQTTVRGKVWPASNPEPAGWQVDAYDAHGNRHREGTIGLWSKGPGTKYWDNLEVQALSCSTDSDGDGVLDCSDACPDDPHKSTPGACGCGVADTDSDGDGVPNCHDQCPGGTDGDSDGDGVANCQDECPGEPDEDSDGDGTLDCDDGCPNDPAKTQPGACGCGTPDADSDSDGVLNCQDGCPSDPAKTAPGACGCGSPDDDNDGDGQPDCADLQPMTAAVRTAGAAPLGVVFDAVNIDGWDSHIVQPANGDYSTLHYRWNFGDPASGSWTSGHGQSNGSFASRNTDTGHISGHVYENPGTYTVTLEVTTASGQVYNYAQQIVVTAFSGTTYYVSAAGNDSWDGLAGTHEGGNRGPFKAFAKGMSVTGSNRRVLLRRGDSWSISGGTTLGGTTGVIGAYGSGNRPRLTVSGSGHGFDVRGADWRIMDLVITGPGGSSSGNGIQGDTANGMTNSLLLRLEISGFDVGIGWSRWQQKYHNHNMIVNCHVHDIHTNGVFIGSQRLAVLGTVIEDIASSHVLRIWQGHKAVIAHSNLHNPGDTRHALKLHSPYVGTGWKETQYVVVAGNDILGKTWPIAIGPQNTTSDERVSHVLFEGNLCLSESSVKQGLSLHGRDITARNNVFDATGASGEYVAVKISQAGIEPAPRRVRVLNNTIYRGDSFSGLTGVEIDGGVLEVTIRNNLICTASSGSVDIATGAAGMVVSHNLATGAGSLVSPGSGNFRLKANSPAIDAGMDVDIHFDADGNIRRDSPTTPNSGAGLTPYYDMGALEYQP